MPTNANTFNSRVTSEALEAKFRQTFPAQGGAELVQDLFASGVIQPIVDFTSVAEGSVLPQNLQTAWDFSTGEVFASNNTQTIVSNSGFWSLQFSVSIQDTGGNAEDAYLSITDGLTSKNIWRINHRNSGSTGLNSIVDDFVVFLRSGDSLTATTTSDRVILFANYRQIADVYGNLENPLGFTFS